METTKTTQKNFTMISDKLCRVPIKKISQTEKLYIAYILRYQANGKTLFATNKTIGEQLGIDGGSIKKLNNKMNKNFNFFSAIQDKKNHNGVEYSSSHTISIDEKLLDEFLDDVSTFTKTKVVKENKAQEATLPTQRIPEYQEEEKVSEKEDNSIRQEIIPILKQRANKYFKNRYNDKHFDSQITDMIEMLEDIYQVKYVDELTDDIIDRLQIELGEPKAFYKVPLFEKEKELLTI
jgi:hypothetical protein